MALEIRQSLNLSQQLVMTPQLQQAIKLLQLSRLELMETITEEMETNPILEEQAVSEEEDSEGAEEESNSGDGSAADFSEVKVEEKVRNDLDWESYLSEYNTGWAETPYEDRESVPFESITSAKTNLYTHLLWQLNMSSLDENQREIGAQIIGNLTEDGYLDIFVEEIARIMGCSDDEVLAVLEVIQKFDPVGVAARDTRECLLIQVAFHELGGTVVESIIRDHLGELENRQFEKIAKQLGIPLEEVLEAVSVIRGLEPKPGRVYSSEEPIYIVPDIYVNKVGDDYDIVLNEDGLPKLRINGYYKDVLTSKDSLSENAKGYIQEKLRSAAWLIKSIHQRQRTIYRVTESIVRFQREFFDHGPTHLKPLVLRTVAEDIEMHESTVSRVTTNKYVYTPQGIYELKFFFNSSISSLDGDSIGSESVRQHIRNIIKGEKSHKPYSDQEVADLLREFNIKVARRTVAKYRESMGILPSRRRKRAY